MDPRVAIDLGFWKIHWYGIIIMVSVFLAIIIVMNEAKRRGEDIAVIDKNAMTVFFAGVVGARLYHVFSSPNDGSGMGLTYYLQNPLQIFALWNGGLGIFGAILGGLIAVVLIIHRNKLRMMRWLDIVVPGVILAQAIARWGNYVNQELYGGPTGSNLWGLIIDPPYRIKTAKYDFTDMNAYPPSTRFHPTFFYESAWNLLGFIMMIVGGRRLKSVLRDGDIAGFYFIWYGVGRTWVELLFRPDAWTIGSLPTAAWIGLAMVVIGLAIIIVGHVRPRTQADVWEIDKQMTN